MNVITKTPRAARFYFQEGLNVQTYDLRAEREARHLGDHLPFYRDMAREWLGPVLELGCGTGRVAKAIAEMGIDVTGLELSPAMLAEAKLRRGTMGLEERERFTLKHGDMSQFRLGKRFPLIIIPHRGFQELADEGAQRATLRRVHAHLTKNGRFVLDLFDPRPDLLKNPSDSEIVSLPPIKLGATTITVEIGERFNNRTAQVLTQRWRFIERDRTGKVLRQEDEIHRMRWIYAREMRLMLEEAGFAVEACYSGFDRKAYEPGTDQVWVARRA